MEERPKILTRARYRAFCNKLQMHDEAKDGFANSFFNKFAIVGDGKQPTDYLDPKGIAAESDDLRAGIEKVLLYANRNLAHRTPDWDVQPIMVPADTDAALRAVQDCFDKFYPILTGKSMLQPTPSIQFDWEDSFRHPWLTPDVAAEIAKAEEAKRQAQSSAVLERIESRGPVD